MGRASLPFSLWHLDAEHIDLSVEKERNRGNLLWGVGDPRVGLVHPDHRRVGARDELELLELIHSLRRIQLGYRLGIQRVIGGIRVEPLVDLARWDRFRRESVQVVRWVRKGGVLARVLDVLWIVG